MTYDQHSTDYKGLGLQVAEWKRRRRLHAIYVTRDRRICAIDRSHIALRDRLITPPALHRAVKLIIKLCFIKSVL